jgi:hypothetical protein
MAIPNGLAPGFYNLEDVMDRRIMDIGAQTVSDAIVLSASIHQNLVNTIYGSVQQRVSWFKRRYRVGGGRSVQSLTESAAPKPQRSGLEYDVALPLQIIGDSIAMNMWAEAAMTVQDMNLETLQVLQAFNRWEIRTFLAAIMANAAWTYADDSDDVGNLTIQGLANGATDGQLYPLRDGSTATIDHYLGQAGSISNTANPYSAAYDVLKQHPTNSGPYVATIASNLVADTKALATFRDLPSDFISYGDSETLASTSIESLRGWGHEVIGVVEGVGSGRGMVIVESDDLPDSRIVTEARGAGPYVGVREQTVNGQAIEVREHMVNSNLKQIDFYRRAGKGVLNRVAATVTEIGDASYDVATGFTAPYVGS